MFYSLRKELKVIITVVFSLLCLRLSAQVKITGTRGISVFDSVMRFEDIKRIPLDTTMHFHGEPEEEGNFDHHLIKYPGVSVIYETQDSSHPHSGNTLQILSPAPAVTFTGLSDAVMSIPPDVQGEAGPGYLMEMENERVQIISKTGASHSIVDLNTFWTSLSPSSCYDPRIRYDPYAKRWIAVVDDYAQSNLSCFYIAVSATSDPTGTWQFHKIRADNTGVTWLDFPMIGFNKNWIVVTGNNFTVSNNTFTKASLWAFDKVSLYNNTATYTFINLGTNGFCTEPATTYDTSVSTEYMAEVWNGTAGEIALCTLTGNIGSEVFTIANYITASIVWSDNPPNAASGKQLGSTHGINLDDDRMHAAVYRNGYIWCAHNAYLPASNPKRCSVQWWQLSTSGAIAQRALIDDSVAGISYAYPSICVNSYNDALIGYSSFGSNQYASANYSFRYSCDTLNKMESDYTYKAGGNSYYVTYGGPSNRWGDYSATMLDTNDVNFWTIQEFASSTVNSWSTQWAEVAPTHTIGVGTWTWTGERSTNWFDLCNWDQGTVPSALSDVVIPGATANQPTISGGAGYCNTIRINTANGALLTIARSSGGILNASQ